MAERSILDIQREMTLSKMEPLVALRRYRSEDSIPVRDALGVRLDQRLHRLLRQRYALMNF